MFVGHYAVAFASKRATPRTSLGVLVLAAQFIDLLWPMFLLIGLEHVRIVPGITRFTPLDFYDYPISHSLVAVVGWSVLFAVIVFARRRDTTAAFVCSALVFSHWLLDFVVHRPDLPVGIHGPSLGLSLWNHTAATFVVEGLMFVIGLWMYMRVTVARDRVGRYGLVVLVTLIVSLWIAGPFSAPPPSARAVAWVSLGQWLFVAMAFWIDSHRSARMRDESANPGHFTEAIESR
jgi:hypothetical protein